MEEPYQIVLATLGVVLVVKVLVYLIAGKGSLARVGPATRAFFAVMGSPDKATKVALVLNPPPPDPAKAPKLSGVPLRLLNLLQRDEGTSISCWRTSAARLTIRSARACVGCIRRGRRPSRST